MVRMRAVIWVIMHFRVGKRVGIVTVAAFSAVDMKPEYGRRTNPRWGRQTVYLCGNNHACMGLIKIHFAAYFRIITASVYISDSIRMLAEYRMQIQKTIFGQEKTPSFIFSICQNKEGVIMGSPKMRDEFLGQRLFMIFFT